VKKAADGLYERELISDACTRATEEGHEVAPHARVFGNGLWGHFPTFRTSIAVRGQRPFQTVITPGLNTLELEGVFAPDIFIGVHRVDRDHYFVPFAYATDRRAGSGQEEMRRWGGTHLTEDPSRIGKAVSLTATLLETNTGE